MKKQRRIKTETLERIAYIFAIVGFPLLLLSTLGVLYQLLVVTRIASSQNNIALNTMFFHSDSNNGIIDAIENGKDILKKNHGEFNNTQLDNYLGDFDTIYQAYAEGLLSPDELCTSFSHYITTANENKEVAEYIKENTKFFGGIILLKDIVAKIPNENCR
jgi:hypothetical protein